MQKKNNESVQRPKDRKVGRRYYYRKPKKSAAAPEKKSAESVRVAFLGGLNEIGKNMTLYECRGDMFLVDCGLSFPDDDLPGVDLVIPDFTFVEKNADKIRGLVVTHGHEDHIGGIAYLLKRINVPVYATKLTIGLIEGKLKEHGLLSRAQLIEIHAGDHISLGCFTLELIHVNHSIPDAVGIAIQSPAGTVIQTGDFKIDTTPIDGDMIDLARFCEYGRRGVLALLSDSTNAERPGFTMSERKVGESFATLFNKANNKRIIVATFASNIHRVQQIIDAACVRGRKVAVIGRSLENLVSIGSELGYLNVPDGVLIPIDTIKSYPDEKLVIITTGSQGEPMSALTKMAFSEHRKVTIGPNDYVIISATPIPGNEKMVSNVVNELMKLGADVIYEKMYEVHVSGHACQEELKLMLGIVKPKYFIPVHGEQKHLQKHAGLAEAMGISKKNIFIGNNGNRLELSSTSMRQISDVPSGDVYVDGIGVGDVGNIVLNDRKHLSRDGIIIVVATIDAETGTIMSGPDIVSRGFVYVRENEELMNRARAAAQRIIEQTYDTRYKDWNTVKTSLRDTISKIMYEKTKRSPMVLPILMEM
ncbi:MAG: ribonuclease J [Clostridiales bacterium]|uniref:Ribonuclease J n=1 Tax=Candidatus Scybalenecus merdavium TaxID=2840939 RepID=A0A9D1MUX3_9FIRM|nr:ribonuclease J [Clostridiales bacterium]HIU69256.1 ribonuclease J [Candidatus Scubalenecus merdavium]